jgi:hypothetical protein
MFPYGTNVGSTTLSIMTFSIITLSIMAFCKMVLSVTLSINDI